MAFFAAFGSSIGKKLLLFGLRQIDILDKDPADFVSVDVGKKTTLEVRDVGLHVKKLIALLHLKLSPEIRLSKARASLFRITIVFEFGVPHIIIEVDGVQIHACLAEEIDPHGSGKQGASPAHPRSPSPAASNDTSSDTELPSIDHLAHSFIREEPEEEIRELEEALHAQSESLQASVASSTASSDDGDENAGMGAPLGLPGMLRNLLNTALDRVQIVINHIDIEVEDQHTSGASTAAQEQEEPSLSLNFHVDRIAVDSVTTKNPQVDIASASTTPAENDASKVGKRRMRVENICARLISEAQRFATRSTVSRSASAVETRSVASPGPKPRSEASVGRLDSSGRLDPKHVANRDISALASSGGVELENGADEDAAPIAEMQASVADLEESIEASHTSIPAARSSTRSLGMSQLSEPPVVSHDRPSEPLEFSVHPADEDRFADAESDDGLDRSYMSDASERQPLMGDQHDMGSSSLLYGDDDVLDYALRNNLINSQPFDPFGGSVSNSFNWKADAPILAPIDQPTPFHAQPNAPYSSSPAIPYSSTGSAGNMQPLSHSMPPRPVQPVTDNLKAAREHVTEGQTAEHTHAPGSLNREEDLTESKIFTHDEAESMYMSAMSGGPSNSSFRAAVPGGWSSSSGSDVSAPSDTSIPIPESMLAGSISDPRPEGDGLDTPRPGTPQSVVHSLRGSPGRRHSHSPSEGDVDVSKVAKTLLTVDHLTVWFPLGLEEGPPPNHPGEQSTEQPELSFSPPNLAQDSVFQEMPGTFSHYALSTTSRRKGSLDASQSAKQRPRAKSTPKKTPSQGPKKDGAATVSVEVGTIIGHMDFSTGRVLFQLLDQVLKLTTGLPTSDQTPDMESLSQSNAKPSLEISIKNIGVAWVERLATDSLALLDATPSPLELYPLHAILKINLASICIASQHTVKAGRSKIQIGKFTLASQSQDIVSFLPPRAKSRRSVSNSVLTMPNDIEIDFEQGINVRITIVTRPVKVTFDLEKLDDALSSFGGFSGILELGNSISSSTSANSPITSVAPKPRGVHFGDVPALPTPVVPKARMPKIDVQIGEVSLLLKGKSCAVRLQTTAVRVAIREINVRMKISEVVLTGPFVDSSSSGAPLIVEVKGTTVNFLFAPEEVDLTKLLSMITPSKDPYENDEDILVDTLLRQRRKGSVLRAEVTSVAVRLSDLAQLQTFEALGSEVATFSKVTKYLPDDDRPGILTLAMVQHFDAVVNVNDKLGSVAVTVRDVSLAHVGVPALLAVELGTIGVNREDEILVHEVVSLRTQEPLPMVMVRIVGDEMEPVVKAKLFNVCSEYHVSTIMAALGLADDGTADDIAVGLASSVATITGAGITPKPLNRQDSQSSSSSTTSAKPLHIDLLLRSCALGLNPRGMDSKALFVLTDARFHGHQSKNDGYSISVELRKASIHAIDDTGRIAGREPHSSPASGLLGGARQLMELREQGYVSMSSIAGAKVAVNITGDGADHPHSVAVEFKNELFVLESCADSTQTLIAILNGLQPPRPPSTAQKYRTIVPLQEMMESFTGDAMMAPESDEDPNFMDTADLVPDEVPTNLEFVGSMYNSGSLPTEEDLGDSILDEDDLDALAPPPTIRRRGDKRLLESFQEQYEITEGEQEFDLSDNYFQDSGSDHKGKARKWD
jgi:autophagy-related protein 2